MSLAVTAAPLLYQQYIVSLLHAHYSAATEIPDRRTAVSMEAYVQRSSVIGMVVHSLKAQSVIGYYADLLIGHCGQLVHHCPCPVCLAVVLLSQWQVVYIVLVAPW